MGDTWVHLRVCQECGHVGCCDQSKNTPRHRALPLDRGTRSSARSSPVRDWYYCYLDDLMFELEGAPPAPSHPSDTVALARGYAEVRDHLLAPEADRLELLVLGERAHLDEAHHVVDAGVVEALHVGDRGVGVADRVVEVVERRRRGRRRFSPRNCGVRGGVVLLS